MDLKRGGEIIPELEDFFSNNQNLTENVQNKLSKYITFEDLVYENIAEREIALSKSLKTVKYFNIISKGLTIFEVSKFFWQLHTGEASPATVLSFHPVFGLLSIVFEIEINRMEENQEIMVLENISSWNDIVDWSSSSTYTYFDENELFLQYVDEKDKYNNEAPTSIRILDMNLAKEIFGFEPKFVNYDFAQEGSFVPRFYSPYKSK